MTAPSERVRSSERERETEREGRDLEIYNNQEMSTQRE